jgi:hypothetical protein
VHRAVPLSTNKARTDEILLHHRTTLVRRLRLAPGEAMPWHRDRFRRIAVVLRDDVLAIEYRDRGESQRIEITPGQVEWEEPTERIQRAVNVGKRVTNKSACSCLTTPSGAAAKRGPTRERSTSRNIGHRFGFGVPFRQRQGLVAFVPDRFCEPCPNVGRSHTRPH